MHSRNRSVALGVIAGAVTVLIGAVAARVAAPAEAAARSGALRAAEEPVIAVCAIPKIVNELMQSDRFKAERDRLQEQLQAELEPLANEMREIGERLQELDPNDPDAEALFERFRDVRLEFGRKQTEMARQLEALNAGQIIECYELARSSAAAVAEDLGYNYVISSVGRDEELTKESVEVAIRQMMARPVILAPRDADITEDVREDLKLN